MCAAGHGWRGGSWNSQDTIVFSAYPKPSSYGFNLYRLYRVSAAGGQPEILVTPDPEKDEGSYTCPKFLPGGKALFLDVLDTDRGSQIRVLSLETGEQKMVVEDGINAYYAPTGHLVYQWKGNLLAAPFDLAKLQVMGNPVPVLKGIKGVDYALAVDGTLAYVPGGGPTRSLVWVDRQGTEELVTEDKGSYLQARISPDGKQMAILVSEDLGLHVWVYDLESDSFWRLTDERTANSSPLWTPDGQWVTFGSDRAGQHHLYRKRADGSSGAEHLATRQFPSYPYSWSPDGNALALTEGPSGNLDISILLKEDGATPRPFLRSPENELRPQFSPDGQWIAYFLEENGSGNLYVRAYPQTDVTWLVLGNQGTRASMAVWSPDGSELFHYDGQKMMAVSVQMEPKLEASQPRVLFEKIVLSRI